MADVTGPISSMPGSLHKVPENQMCDDHPDRLATARVQGETDSFGSEMIDMCDECLEKMRSYEKEKDRSGVCDWCKNNVPRLSQFRDYDEGMCGRLYDVCDPCIEKANAEAEAELEANGYFNRPDDDDDDDFDDDDDDIPHQDDSENYYQEEG